MFGGAESAAQPSGVTVNILCTVNNAGDPLTVNRVSSQGSEDHYTYAYLPAGGGSVPRGRLTLEWV